MLASEPSRGLRLREAGRDEVLCVLYKIYFAPCSKELMIQ